MKAQEIGVKPKVNVVLEGDNQMLDEVMIVAYGTANIQKPDLGFLSYCQAIYRSNLFQVSLLNIGLKMCIRILQDSLIYIKKSGGNR